VRSRCSWCADTGWTRAILFSDIGVPLRIAGIGVEILAGTGPVVAEPVRTAIAGSDRASEQLGQYLLYNQLNY
jgi:uroporphyrinogen-III decarboxylase